MSHKTLTCVFLGSGASNALAGIPIQSEFVDKVLEGKHDWLDKCEEERHRLTIGGATISDWMHQVGDVELSMSHLHNVAYAEPVPKDDVLPAGPRRHAVRALINLRTAVAESFLVQRPTTEVQQHVQDLFRAWLTKLKRNPGSLVILTTNYDLVIERVLGSNFDCYTGLPMASSLETHGGAVRLYKLHGSINWMEERWFAEENIRSHDPPEIKSWNEQLGTQSKIEKWAYLFADNGNLYCPVIITFFYQKEAWLRNNRWEKLFLPHWDNAQKYLSRENRLEDIYFIGYSLPPADHYMLTWLLSILNRTKPKVTIVRKGGDNPSTLEKALKPFNPKVYECGLENFLDGHV